MKKYLIKLCLFIFFVFFVYVIGLNLLGGVLKKYTLSNILDMRGAYGHMFSRMKQASEIRDVDILVLGSSHAYRGFDPRVFREKGIEIFNLGSSSQSPMQTKLLLDRYLENLTPEIIIYEVYPIPFGSDGIESSLDIISNSAPDRHTFDLVIEQNHIKIYNRYFMTLKDVLLNKNESFKEAAKKKLDTYVDGGFVERKMEYFIGKPLPKRKRILNDIQLAYFEKNAKIIKDKNIKLILVYAPITRELNDSFEYDVNFDSLMTSFGHYYNLNNISIYPDSLFYDSNHLNQKGVVRFNKELIELLDRDGLLE